MKFKNILLCWLAGCGPGLQTDESDDLLATTQSVQSDCPLEGCGGDPPDPEECGPAPEAQVCNRLVCAEGIWETRPRPAGVSCNIDGVEGACSGGSPNTTGVCLPLPPCTPGQTSCGGACVDLLWDESHCGGCGNACSPGGTCEYGQCYPTPATCGACVDGTQSCCWYESSDQRFCGDRSCVTPCAVDDACSRPGVGDLCSCSADQTCSKRCGQICGVNWFLCSLFPPIGCFPQCYPGTCTTDSFCG